MEPRAGGAPSQRISPITKGELVFQRSTDVESDLMIRFGDDQVVPTILQDGGFAGERQGLRRLYGRKLVKEPVVVRLNQGNPGLVDCHLLQQHHLATERCKLYVQRKRRILGAEVILTRLGPVEDPPVPLKKNACPILPGAKSTRPRGVNSVTLAASSMVPSPEYK